MLQTKVQRRSRLFCGQLSIFGFKWIVHLKLKIKNVHPHNESQCSSMCLDTSVIQRSSFVKISSSTLFEYVGVRHEHE